MGTIHSIQNALQRNMARVFPGWGMGSTKHDHACDFGWPERPDFETFYRAYTRNGLAASAVNKTISKTWETMPELWENEKPAESQLEADISRHFSRKRIWRGLMMTDQRSMVGRYAGAIILLADSKALDQPVDRVPGGIQGLAGIIPAWEGQLTVVEWDEAIDSPTYGDPVFFQYDESATGNETVGRRQLRIHRDRIIVWSEDGTINCNSSLQPGLNDLIDAEKVKGAGGEGFWKTSRGTPVITAPENVSMKDVMSGMGAQTPADVQDKINEQLENWMGGFDKGLMLGGFEVQPLTINLPQPEEFFNIPVQSFAASMQMPVRILIGNQTGERASTEDAREWAQTNMSRRENVCIPLINDFVDRLVLWGILPQKDYAIGWVDLTEATAAEKMDRATKMSAINAQSIAGDGPLFLPDEVREAAGYDPMSEVEGYVPGTSEPVGEDDEVTE